MTEKRALEAIAEHVRPLLAELADSTQLPRGVLGIILLPGRPEQPRLFAEYVASGAEEEDRDEQDGDSYTLDEYHPFVKCLIAGTTERCVLEKQDAALAFNDVYAPICALFGAEESVPENILICRIWARPRVGAGPGSAIYFLPTAQGVGWDDWHDRLRLAGKLTSIALRLTLVVLMSTDQSLHAEARLLLKALPEYLRRTEERLLDTVVAHARYVRDVQSVELRVGQSPMSKDVLVLTAKRQLQEDVHIVEIKRPPGRSDIDVTWTTAAGTNSGNHLFVTTLLAVAKAAFSKDNGGAVAWEHLFELVYPNEPARPKTGFQDSFHEETERHGGPMQIQRGPSTALQRNIKKLDARVKRADLHLRRMLGVGSKPILVRLEGAVPTQHRFQLRLPATFDTCLSARIRSSPKEDWVQALLARLHST